ncbi:MAG: DUF3971 domain-containing protein, partial [Brachymonas sp.]|nr:DUF3971 domain-containing protein [Brachymonas sp.]
MLAGCVLVLLLAAVGLHVWILPRINDWRPTLEKTASNTVGLPVRIGELITTRRGWQPDIELRDVRILDEQGQDALSIRRIETSLSAFTLLRAGFARLAVIDPVLQAQRLADGRITVAGMVLPQNQSESAIAKKDNSGAEAAMDWLLKQPELSISNGRVVWRDALRDVPPLLLEQVQAHLHNTGHGHALQVKLQPPQGWGQTVALQADWRHGLFKRPSNTDSWQGKAQLQLPELNVSQLRQYVDMGRHIKLEQGQGSLQVEMDFKGTSESVIKVDTRLDAVNVTLGKDLEPLALKNLESQLQMDYRRNAVSDFYQFATSKLAFTTYDGDVWQGGNVRVSLNQPGEVDKTRGELQGDNWDIYVINQLATRLPLGDAVLNALKRHQPQGFVKELHVQWQGDINAPVAYAAKGSAQEVGWFATHAPVGKDGKPGIGVPGLEGAHVAFDFTHAGGKMDIAIDKGHAIFPGVFADPQLYFDTFKAGLQWTVDGQKIRLHAPDIRVSNPDVEGQVQLVWHTNDEAAAQGGNRFPGIMELQGELPRARAEKVVRYLPLDLGKEALAYIGQSVRSGDIRNAQVRIAGDLDHIPFGKDSKGVVHPGTFVFEVPLSNAEYQFVPAYLQDKGDLPWPSLVKLNGLLVIDKSSLSVRNATARFSIAPDIQINDLAAHIPDLGHDLTVSITGKLRGPMQQALDVTKNSPLARMIGNSLDKATATGASDIELDMKLPVMRMDDAQFKGIVKFEGNDIRLTPDTPLLTQGQGKVVFDEKGFAMQQVSAGVLGGRAQLEGGTVPAVKGQKQGGVKVQARGQFSAEGLRNEPSVGTIASIGKFLQGQSPYQADLHFRAGTTEMDLRSDLVGMRVDLPQPLGKAAGGRLPFQFVSKIAKVGRDKSGSEQAVEDALEVRFGDMVLARYGRELRGDDAHVLRGSVAVGTKAVAEPPPLPDAGVHALVYLDRVDSDAWMKVLETGWGEAAQPMVKAQKTPAGEDDAAVRRTDQYAAGSYLPDQVAMATPLLVFADRHIENLVVGGAREGRLWKLSLTARQLNGYVEFLQSATGGPGSVKARLSDLTIAPANVEEVATYVRQTADPKSLPMLDIEAQKVDFLGYKMDKVVVRAGNTVQARPAGAELVDEDLLPGAQHAWRIHELSASLPNTTLRGSGIWGVATGSAQAGEGLQLGDLAKRFVSLQVRLDTRDMGGMLAHFGQKSLARGGRGSLAGTIRWAGSPVSPDLESLDGHVRLDMRQGSITSIKPGAAKILSLLSLQGLTRLGDMGSEGFVFDRIHGTMRLAKGTAYSDDLAV